MSLKFNQQKMYNKGYGKDFPNTDENNPSLKMASAMIEEWNGWLQTEKSSPGSFELFVYDLWAHAGYKTFKNKN